MTLEQVVQDTAAEAERIEAALADLTAIAGIDARAARAVKIDGGDPVLPTPYRIGGGGATSPLAVWLAASALHEVRGGRPQEIGVSVPAAVASLRGNHYLTINGEKPQRPWGDVSGFYKVKDHRTIFLHCNFPNLRDRAVAVLGVPPETEAVARACLEWDGESLETAIHENGGCAGFVRTREEWFGHPHGAAVNAMPLMEIIRIGDAAPEPLRAAKRPLSGVRVLDLTRVIAGPACSRTLAEHGADVLKVSRPDLPHSGMLDLDSGVGKRSTYLDFRLPAQHKQLKDLIRTGDVFVQSYRPGALAAHGFGPEDLAALRPGVVVATLSAWGHEGAWRNRRGYDTVVQSATGMADLSGQAAGEPAFLPVSALDYISGNLLAFGVMTALRHRALSGGSWLVRTSLVTVQHWLAKFGLQSEATISALPPDLPADVTAPFMRSFDIAEGTLRYLGPVLTMSGTPPGTDDPPVPLGTNRPEWANR